MPSYVLKRRKQVLAPNITTVGNPTIVDNVASGFVTGTSYLTYPEVVDVNGNWEAVLKLRTEVTPPDSSIFSFPNNNNFGCQLNVSGGKFLFVWNHIPGNRWDTYDTGVVIPVNKDVWVKYTKAGAIFKLYTSDDGLTYTEVASREYTATLYTPNTGFSLGGAVNNQVAWNGSIDLNESYIKINGELWWSGTHYVPDDKSYILKRKINKYYKDIVTTKYWKEVETITRELDYACYKNTFSDTHYNYVKVPFGTDDNKLYYCTKGLAKSSADFEGSDVYISITEEQLKDLVFTSPRYTDGDLYKETTTTEVVEGTPDDYTYTTTETETVEVSANDDWDRVVAEGEPAYLLKTIKYRDVLNVSEVGSFAKIDKGIASGFSASNYLTLPEVFNPQSNTWEQVWSVTTGANTSTTYQEILAQSNVGTAAVSGYDLRVNAGKILLWVEATSFTGATVLQDYTHYLIKAQYTGSAYILSYSTDNGASWVEDCNVASTVTGVPDMNIPQYVGVWKSTYNSTPDKAWLGSIDLSQSYININGERWWSGDIYTKVGSWIDRDKFVASGFTTANYLTLPKTFNVSDGSTWEVVFKFTTKNVGTYQFFNGVDYNGFALSINTYQNTTKKLTLFLSTAAGSWSTINAGGVTTLVEDTVYFAKVLFNGSEYQVLLADNADFNDATTEITISSTTPVSPLVNMLVGGLSSGSTGALLFQGSIDFTQSYIKIKDELWWSGVKAEKY